MIQRSPSNPPWEFHQKSAASAWQPAPSQSIKIPAKPEGTPYPPEMDEEASFRRKWNDRIDACGPYCSCLVIIVILIIAFFAFVVR